MLLSIVSLLAIVQLAVSAPPAAQATYCSEDNLLRAFQHTPTPASSYCVRTTGYPTFLAVSTYLSSRLSSACSCFSRFPSEGVPTSTSSSVAPTPTCFKFDATGANSPHKIVHLVITADLSKPCGGTGYQVTNVCGTFSNYAVSFDGDTDYKNAYGLNADDCFYPNQGYMVDKNGVDFDGTDPNEPSSNIFLDQNAANGIQITGYSGAGPYPGNFVAVSCAAAPCPSPTY